MSKTKTRKRNCEGCPAKGLLAFLVVLFATCLLRAQAPLALLNEFEKAATPKGKMEAMVKISNHHSDRKEVERALEYLARAMKINDQSPVYHYEDDIFFSALIKTIKNVSLNRLKHAFSTLPKDAQTPSFYNLFGYQAIYDHDPSYAIEIGLKALDLSKSSKNTLQVAESHFNIGRMMYDFGTSNDEETHFIAALRVFQAIPDTLGMSKTKHYIGQLYQWDFQMEEALQLLDEALTLACAIENRKLQFLIQESIIEIKLSLGEYGEVVQIQTELYCLAHELEPEDPNWLILARNIEGVFLMRIGNFKDALPLVKAASRRYEADEQEFSFLPLAYYRLGKCYFNTGVYDTAVIYYQKSIDYAKKYSNDHTLRESLKSLAMLHFEIGDKETGLEYSDYVSQQFSDTSCTDIIEFQDQQFQWNIVFFEKTGELDSALYYAKEVLAIFEEKGLHGMISNIFQKIGNLYNQLGQPDSAKVHFQQALENAKKIGQKGVMAKSLLHLAEANIDQQDFNAALAHARSSLELAEKYQMTHLLPDIYKSLSIAFAKTGDFQSAYQYQSLHGQLQDSLFGFVQKQQIAKYGAIYKIKEMKLDNERLQTEKEYTNYIIRKRTNLILTLSAGLLLIGIGAFFYKERAKLMAEYNLRKQITRDIHDDVGGILNNLKMTAKEALEKIEDTEFVEKKLDRTVQLGNQAMESLKNLIWNLEAKKIQLNEFAEEIKTLTQEMLSTHQIPFHLDLAGFEAKLAFSPTVHHHLLLIYKEALHNAVKHGDHKKVEIYFAHHDGIISMRMKNGIPEKKQTTNPGLGKGLQNMAERAALLGGNIVFCNVGGRFELNLTFPAFPKK